MNQSMRERYWGVVHYKPLGTHPLFAPVTSTVGMMDLSMYDSGFDFPADDRYAR